LATLVAADDATAVGAAKLINHFVGFSVKGLEAVTLIRTAFTAATAFGIRFAAESRVWFTAR
jgi:hypothetical protein